MIMAKMKSPEINHQVKKKKKKKIKIKFLIYKNNRHNKVKLKPNK